MKKSILLDSEAFEALSREMRADETFSEVIRAHFGGRTTVADFKRRVAGVRLESDTLDAIDELIRTRGESPASAADL